MPEDVLAHCVYYRSTVRRSTYSLDHAYKQARKFARPLAALGAGVPLSREGLSEFAYEIFDALASWADAEDAGAHAIAAIFRTYAFPGGSYRHVKATRPRPRPRPS